jgi:predicted ATPase/class 3 adenylate cyclase
VERRNNVRRKDRRVAAGEVTAPTGNVAFLFTDVEASTRRWERYGEAMRDALRRHDRIMRAEIEARQGYVFKTIGDAFCASFPGAAQALDAAVAAQRRLAREDFSAVDGLLVRMAIHVGEADEREGDYFGSAPNRAARLLSAGHGGQILLSGDAADSTLPDLPAEITLRHLGTLPLRDIKEPERVYQPVGEGLRSEFKALRALETPPNNLPRQTTSFVGRHDDLARVEALLDEGPLATIVGAGGIGKTRLALEIAAARLNDERDGAWFVDLSAVGDPQLIAGTMLATLGGELSADGNSLDDLLAYLEKRDLLLVLDNSEHLVAEVAKIVAQIIARASQVTVLATSRLPLDISGERLYRLSSLDSAAAVQLFGDRARAVNQAFRLEPKLGVVEAICNRLDGIALAIELAAARVRTMSVESLASHLELRLLAGGRDRRPRQQTMRALIDWSYDLLAQEEQRVLRRAAVFLRGFTLDVALRVCCNEGDDECGILDLLASLVDKSLVVADSQADDQRYRLLEPIREYAWEKLDAAGELAQTRRRHATAFAALAAQWFGEWDEGPRRDWIARIERDLANLRVALRWSVEEGNDLDLGARLAADSTVAFLRLGLPAEGLEWGRRVLQSGLQLRPGLEARQRYGLSMLYSNIGDNKRCLAEALTAVPLYRSTGDKRGLARALSQVSSRFAPQSHYDDARSAANEALQLARESGDRRLLADVLRRCASSFANDGSDAVRALYAESVALFRSLGRDDDTARAIMWWGQWEEQTGNYSQAIELLIEAAQLDDSDEATVYHAVEIASCYLALGDPARAEPFARKGVSAATKARHAIEASLSIAYLAAVAADRDPQRAARLLGYARPQLREADWEFDRVDSATIGLLDDALRRQLEDAELSRLLSEGSGLTEDQAVALALAS